MNVYLLHWCVTEEKLFVDAKCFRLSEIRLSIASVLFLNTPQQDLYYSTKGLTINVIYN